MKSWSIDVAVLLIFFVRDETFSRVFQEVKKARPRQLLLWQDGPRENHPHDLEGIKKCREIALDIDWECEVYTHFNEKNYGCDPSTFYADKWAFSIVDKCIVLEDDQLPTQSFFVFCKELLDRYEHDNRISHICGHNFIGGAKWCPNDYLFAYTGTGAWASWRRVAKQWDEEYSFLDNDYDILNLEFHFGNRSKEWIEYSTRHRKSGKAHWESILGMGEHLNSQYAIIPKINMVQNIGITPNATHSSFIEDMALLPKSSMRFFEKAEEISFPLVHPTAVLPDKEYVLKSEKLSQSSTIKTLSNRIEMTINILKNRRVDLLKRLILKKLKK